MNQAPHTLPQEPQLPSTADSTGAAPSFRAPAAATHVSATRTIVFPEVGDRLGDFELVRLLGEGAFARVFLARELSLDRLVALKISPRHGSEARTLARLEHVHIVQVFQQTVDEARDLLLLCMQYVPGTTLERIRLALRQYPRAEWSGRLILDIVDLQSIHHEMFDPGAVRDRNFLAGCDFYEAVCWLGARLADALEYAHKQGVLHRDIKPANILVNSYGRPLLADFNIASGPASASETEALFGGTLGYMAPEHIDAFDPTQPALRERVDERSDIYSLGVVLFELLTGSPCHAVPGHDDRGPDKLKRVAQERRTGARSPRERCPDLPLPIDRVVRRCLHPDPADRYANAAELSGALDGCMQLRHVERTMPAAGPLTRLGRRHVLLAAWFPLLLPHVLASCVNIPYNAIRIVSSLSDEQQAAFEHVVLWYNLIVYPICLAIAHFTVTPVTRVLRRLERGVDVTRNEVEEARHRLLRWPFRALVWSSLGWLPGAVLFPVLIDSPTSPVSAQVYLHFAISFTISGLIALTYSVLGLQFVVLRIFYPRLWLDGRGLHDHVETELRGVERRLYVYQFLAGIIPLAGALLMIGVGPEKFTTQAYQNYRLLLTAMILLGSIGFGVALLTGNRLGKMMQVLLRRPREYHGSD
jgi:serine/threonine protein kinase